MRRFWMATVATLIATGAAARTDAQQTAPSAAARDSLAQTLERERATATGRNLPSVDRFTWGDLSIPAGSTVDGPVAAARGNISVRGLVNGDVYVVGGDVVVHPGGEVTGSALALQGRVIIDGGRVGGEMKAATPLAASTAAPLTGTAAVRHALMITAAWFAVVLLVGLGVIVFSAAQLEGVVQALQHRFSTALAVGFAAQVGALPLLVMICLALALTVVGILLIPFAIVAYILGVAGLITMGALAAVSVAGQAIVREGANVRIRAVRSMVAGTVLLILPWVAAALLVNSPWGEMLARIAAVALTWVAGTAGLGAALMARGGVRRVHLHVASAEVSPAGWQTPTPIGGIVATRRPTATPSSTSGTLH
jgi:hypothetical protein